MTNATFPLGFRVVGGVRERRVVVNAHAAFVAHCAADDKADPTRECYLSAFRYGDEFQAHMDKTGSPRGYAGPCWSPWLWFDIDRQDDLPAALADTRRLVGFVLERYTAIDEGHLLLFFSGSKGFHVGLPLPHGPAPSPTFHKTCGRLAEGLATQAGVTIDTGVYDRVRLFRAPNSRHPKTGLHKRPLTHDELMNLTIDRIRELAAEPHGIDVPEGILADDQLATDWGESEVQPVASRPPVTGDPRLNRATLDFIRDGASEGERHPRLFSAAANLAEFGAPPPLIHALLSQAASDSGLPPGGIKRQIDCGIAHVTTNQRGGTQ